MVNPEIRLNVDVTASRAEFCRGNETFCCGSYFCVQLRVKQPSPPQGPLLNASLINPHPLPAPPCFHQRVIFLMPRTCAAIYLSSPPKDCEGLCQIFNCIFLAKSHSLVLRKRSISSSQFCVSPLWSKAVKCTWSLLCLIGESKRVRRLLG